MKTRLISGIVLALALTMQASAQSQWSHNPEMSGSVMVITPHNNDVAAPGARVTCTCNSTVTDSDTLLVCPFGEFGDTVEINWTAIDSLGLLAGSWQGGDHTGTPVTWIAPTIPGRYQIKAAASDAGGNPYVLERKDGEIHSSWVDVYVPGIIKLTVLPDHRGTNSGKYYLGQDDEGYAMVMAEICPPWATGEITWDSDHPGGIPFGSTYLLPTDTEGEYTVTAAYGNCNSASVTIVVLKASGPNVTGATRVGEANAYCTWTDTGDVVITAGLDPAVIPADLPEGFFALTGRYEVQNNYLERRLPKATATSETYIVTLDGSSSSATVYVVDDVDLTLEYSPDTGLTWLPCDDLIFVPKDTLTLFRTCSSAAQIQPWLDGMTTWTLCHGTETVEIGSGGIVPVILSTVSEDLYDAWEVSANCGGRAAASTHVVVVDLAPLEACIEGDPFEQIGDEFFVPAGYEFHLRFSLVPSGALWPYGMPKVTGIGQNGSPTATGRLDDPGGFAVSVTCGRTPIIR
jgi:hypothetical protein